MVSPRPWAIARWRSRSNSRIHVRRNCACSHSRSNRARSAAGTGEPSHRRTVLAAAPMSVPGGSPIPWVASRPVIRARRRGTGTAWSLRYTRRCGSLWSSSAPLFLVLAETRLQELTSSGPLCFFHCTFIGSRWRMLAGSLAERHDGHQQGHVGLTLGIAGGSISFEEAMPEKVRVNLANLGELLELPGVDPSRPEPFSGFVPS